LEARDDAGREEAGGIRFKMATTGSMHGFKHGPGFQASVLRSRSVVCFPCGRRIPSGASRHCRNLGARVVASAACLSGYLVVALAAPRAYYRMTPSRRHRQTISGWWH